MRTVQLTIKDEYLRSIQRQRPQNPPTDISREIAETAYKIYLDEWSEHKPVRMFTVTATGLTHADMIAEQITMFDTIGSDVRDKNKKREIAVDKIKQRYGYDAISQGSLLDSDLGIFAQKKEKRGK